jgi:hypothetical protein
MLSRVVGLSASGLLGLRPRSALKTALWLQNGPWRSSVLGTNRQAAISTSTKRTSIFKNKHFFVLMATDRYHQYFCGTWVLLILTNSNKKS